MLSPIGVAIVGPGKVAHTHARALTMTQGARLVAVCGRTPDRTAAFAAQYGVHAYAALDDLLHDREVQAVILCTPHPQHAAQAIAAVQAGKHVLVEKPLATTVADCDRIIAAARAANVTLGAGRRQARPARAGDADGAGLAQHRILCDGRVARNLGR
jgi:UDP-N-acetyl-2-amino-2-deoxyglucuronate dehydrogenase